MEKKYFENLDETIYFDQLDNGLRLYVLHKKDFQKTYATFTTEYGSIDNSFIVNGEKIVVPDGIAHFLEHKMFEEEEGDIFHTFASNGAQANAFTSFNRTTYLFSSTGRVMTNLATLIDFVQRPYFTTENVEKEKGIIAQEIQMYEDNPDWRLYFGLLRSLYKEHPIRVDIAGSVKSIYEITKEQLYTCYETFYHPSNMILFVVSQENPEEIIQLVRENQSKKVFSKIPTIERVYPDEPSKVNEFMNSLDLSIALPKVLIGFKEYETGMTGKDFIKSEVATQILLDVILGQSSDVYEKLSNLGILNEDFSYEYQIEQNYAFTLVGGSTKDPDQLVQKIVEEIKHKKEAGLDEHLFESIKKKKIGDFLRKMNSPEFIANQFTRYIFNGTNLLEVLPILEGLKMEDIEHRLSHLDTDNMSVTKIVPNS